MALLLETTLGDLVIDLDVEGSPALSKNILELAQARYYTSTLIYNIQANRFCQLGDPRGDGTGGACWQGVLDQPNNVTQSKKRFFKSQGRRLTAQECQEKGRVVATEMKGIPDTIGSQFLITLAEGPGMALDGYTLDEERETPQHSFLSLGKVTEDDNHILDQLNKMYCDSDGRPYADVRVKRALVVHNPFEDPPEMKELMKIRGVELDDDDLHHVTASPDYDRPPEERVEPRVPADQVQIVDDENEEELAKLQKHQDEEAIRHETKSRAVVLEMLGDLPSAEIKAPENVLFVCKLNSVTEDEDLELIFSRFDPNVKAEIIRDHDTGASLQYAFVEFTKKQQAVEAYFKMNNALIDDRRVKVDFSQSVAKIWDKYNQRMKLTALPDMNDITGRRNYGGRGAGRGGRGGRGGGRGDYHEGRWDRRRDYRDNNRRGPPDRSERGFDSRDQRRVHGRDDKAPTYDRNRQRDPHERNGAQAQVDEFGRARVGENERKSRSLSGSVSSIDRRQRYHHRSRSRGRSVSRSRSLSPSPEDRRRPRQSQSRSRSISPDDRHSRRHDRRKHHKHSRKHKKKRRHDDDRHRRKHPDNGSAEGDRAGHKRRHDSDDYEVDHHHKRRRYDSEDSKEGNRKHSKHHKRHKRSRSR